MTTRRSRTRRLAELRLAQHTVASARLREERASLEICEGSVASAQRAAGQTLEQAQCALTAGDRGEWLLANAAFQLHSLQADRHRAACLQMEAEVAEAEAAERAARMELRQTESMLKSILADERALHERAEQQTLDEAARVSARSSKSQHHWISLKN